MYADIKGLRLRYEVRGQGTPVLLLHGWGACIETFAPVATFLQTLHTVYSIDFPGHGQSDEPKDPWSVCEYMEWLYAFMQLQCLKRCDIIAHSFGGRVSILLASDHPECINRLVLCDSAGVLPKRSFSYYLKVYSYKAIKFLGKAQFINRLLSLDKRLQNVGSSDYKNLSPIMKASFVRIVNQDLTPYLSAIKAPTLLIWGENDQDTPLYMAQIMERLIADSALIVFNSAGHYAYLDDTPRFNAIIASFLGGT